MARCPPPMPPCPSCGQSLCYCDLFHDDDDGGGPGAGMAEDWEEQPVGRCEWCDQPLFADDEPGLCDRCAWLSDHA